MSLFEIDISFFHVMSSQDTSKEVVADLNNQDLMRYTNQQLMDHSIYSRYRCLASFTNTLNQYVESFIKKKSDLAVTLTFLSIYFILSQMLEFWSGLAQWAKGSAMQHMKRVSVTCSVPMVYAK